MTQYQVEYGEYFTSFSYFANCDTTAKYEKRTILDLSLPLTPYLTLLRGKLYRKNKHVSKHQGFQNMPHLNNQLCLNIQGNTAIPKETLETFHLSIIITLTKAIICKLLCSKFKQHLNSNCCLYRKFLSSSVFRGVLFKLNSHLLYFIHPLIKKMGKMHCSAANKIVHTFTG